MDITTGYAGCQVLEKQEEDEEEEEVVKAKIPHVWKEKVFQLEECDAFRGNWRVYIGQALKCTFFTPFPHVLFTI